MLPFFAGLPFSCITKVSQRHPRSLTNVTVFERPQKIHATKENKNPAGNCALKKM